MLTLEEYKKELENQIKSNRSLIYITTHEEHRVIQTIQSIACERAKPWSFVFWDIASGGFTNASYKFQNNMDQAEILTWFSDLIIEKDDFCVLVLHDFYKFLAPEGHPGQMEIATIRALKNLIEKCHTERKCVILTGAKYYMPLEFEKLVSLLDWPLPDQDLILQTVSGLVNASKSKPGLSFRTDYSDVEFEAIVKAFQGLSLREIEMISTYFILTDSEFNPKKIANKKQDIIKQSGILEWIDLEYDLSSVGGLSNLKDWLIKRKDAFSDKAIEYGLPAHPKGLLIIGIQGAGKCFKKGTQVLMHDGTHKNVEDITGKDLLMGPDGLSRAVKGISEGFDTLYKITPVNGEIFYVNGDHILHVDYCKKRLNISVKDFLNQSIKFQKKCKLVKAYIDKKSAPKKVEPYMLGAFLSYKDTYNDALVPHWYKKLGAENLSSVFPNMSAEDRTKVLEGFLDFSGKLKNKTFYLKIKDQNLTKDITDLARSLCFQVNSKQKNKYTLLKISNIGLRDGVMTPKTVLTKFTVTKDIEDSYYGFEVDKDHLFVLSDYTIVHNSRSSKAIASFWGLPLLRLDMGRIFSGIVGSSEENLRSVIKTAESVAPCILWCDEIDKAFSNTSFSGDSGTSSRIFGTFLTWMQEKKSSVFVVATANNVSHLPPELIRKGRFDDIFFVDLPDSEERKEIWEIHLKQRNFDVSEFNINDLVNKSEGFTGAEIEAAIISSMYEGFSDNQRRITTVDIIKELKESIPIYVTMRENIEALREWASKRARNASKKAQADKLKHLEVQEEEL